MKNYEKYADKIREYKGSDICEDVVKPYILKSDSCGNLSCGVCHMLQMIWLLEDYEEPEEPKTDWSKVKVDTPILVRDTEHEDWYRRYFSKYVNGAVCAWDNGYTSWTASDDCAWKYAKLAESEESDE